jgi:predicted metal-binding protein
MDDLKDDESFGPRSRRRQVTRGQFVLTVSKTPADAPVVYVCITCKRAGEPDSEPRPGAILAAATARAAAGTEVEVRQIRCLANCTRGASAAMRCNGSWTYVFGGLDVSCAGALIEGARLLATAADGILPWRGRPEPLKRGLISRVPPIDFEGLEE